MNELPMRELTDFERAELEQERDRRAAMPETKKFKPQMAGFAVALAAVALGLQHPDRGVHREDRLTSRSAEDLQERRDKHAAKLARRAARAQK